jgi:hygromycin-B 4-O-kinase
MPEGELTVFEVKRFLRDRFATVGDVTLVRGGAWSTAFAFTSGDRPLVVRFGRHVEDYEKDRIAGASSRSRLPTAAVYEIGEAFDGAYAVSQRLPGDKLDELPPERLNIALDSLVETLTAVAELELPGRGFGVWHAPGADAAHPRWRDFLTAVPSRDDERLRGWRDRLAAAAPAQRVFDAAQQILEELVASCPDRRGVISRRSVERQRPRVGGQPDHRRARLGQFAGR